MKKIILFFKKIYEWFLNLLFGKKKNKNKKRMLRTHASLTPKDKVAKEVMVSHRDEDKGSSHIKDVYLKDTYLKEVYPLATKEEIKEIYDLIDEVKEKIEKYANLEDKDIKDIEKTQETIKEIEKIQNIDIKEIEELKDIITEELTVKQTEEIKDNLMELILDDEIEVEPKEKIEVLKESINKIVDNTLDVHEEELIEKAYQKYEKVNYAIATTMEIEELEEDIKDLVDEIKINNRKKSHYTDKIKELKKKIERLKKINKNPKVQDELKRLQDDLYTKTNDKYDLLYSKEVFINLEKQCDDLFDLLEEKEQEKEEIKENRKRKEEEKEQEKKRIREEKKQEKERKEQLKREEREKEEIEEENLNQENIIKRYKDMRLAADLLSIGILMHTIRRNRKNVVEVILDDYDEYLKGEESEFNFDRNKQKTEVGKLYNSLMETLTAYQELPFEPISHINYPYENLLEETISVKDAVDRITAKKTGYDMLLDEKSVMVYDKLNEELTKEKEKNREKGIVNKVLIRKVGKI